MTDKQFALCWDEASNYTDRDAYVSDLALSSIWADAPEDDVPPERLEKLGEIWDAAHRSVREIAQAAGLSHRKLAERFAIPYRTMEDWCRCNRIPPDYVRMMMQELLGLIKR